MCQYVRNIIIQKTTHSIWYTRYSMRFLGPRAHLLGIRISIIKIKQLWDHLIFIMEIPILVQIWPPGYLFSARLNMKVRHLMVFQMELSVVLDKPVMYTLKMSLERVSQEDLNTIQCFYHMGKWIITLNNAHMMTSSNGNIFHVTGLLCGEFTGHRWIPRTKASDAELWCFLWSAPG